ncbi:MFS transporter [Streptomyces sp. NBC_00091]|uniref:MFS transporter n=1 Tax=Streptomyces sp. NBC_00091 TaxID=2975648 RepID=UPI00225407D8|nr:MFS transporter [Streptomyces sp. NBC_00091]MCX5379919.1 MFS transporter [Streptomyces sp. NBC_00091]
MLRHARTPAAARADDAPAPAPGLSRPALLVLCACVLVAQGMVAAVNLLIPQLAASTLRPSPGQLLWAVDAYVIVFAALLIPAGALGDRYGRKGALLAGLGLFAAGGALSALARDPATLIAGRGLCGAGAALIMPATMSVLVHLSPPERRGQALATWTLAAGLGGLAGNVGGGLAGEFLTWRALFWAVVPLGALLALAVARTVPRTPSRADAAVDPVGALVLAGALFAVVHGIIEGPAHGWSSARVLGSFGAGAVLLAAFAGHALRTARPLLDPRIFASGRLRAGALGIGAAFFGLFALFFVNAQYLQYAKGFSPALTGLAIVPLTIGMAVVPRLGARLQERTGPRLPVGAGLLLIGAGLLLVSTVDAGTPYALYAVYLLVLSAGTGLCAPSLTLTVVSELPPHQAGLGSGLNTAAREIGAALGVAVVGTVLASRFHGNPADPAQAGAFTDAMGVALRSVAAVLLVASAVVVRGYRGTTGKRAGRRSAAAGGEGAC